MAAATTFIIVIGMALSATATPFNFELGGDTCDISDLNVDYAVSQMLSRLPKKREITNPVFYGQAAEIFETGRMELIGMDTLKRYGPVQSYCVNDTRLIQFDLVSDGGAQLAVPWRSCSGKEGMMTLVAGYTRFTVQLRVEGSGSDARMQYMGPTLPVATEDLDVVFEGAGPSIRTAVGVISKFFNPILREIWNAQFFRQFKGSLEEILPVGVNEV